MIMMIPIIEIICQILMMMSDGDSKKMMVITFLFREVVFSLVLVLVLASDLVAFLEGLIM